MAKFYGAVGYVINQEIAKGVWKGQPIEMNYYGDVTRNTKRVENGEHLNDDVNIANTISIVADAYAYQNCSAIRYVKWMGAYWKVSTVEIQSPRLILSLGGVYNGPTVGIADNTGGDS